MRMRVVALATVALASVAGAQTTGQVQGRQQQGQQGQQGQGQQGRQGQQGASPQILQGQAGLVTKTVDLRSLKPIEATKLLMPYIISPYGLVAEISDKIPAVTIRDVASNIGRLEDVLAKYDRPSATISLRFDIVRADNSNSRDPSMASMDSVLRGVLKFTGYKIVGRALGNAATGAYFEQTVDVDDDAGSRYVINTTVLNVRPENGGSVARLAVRLTRRGAPTPGSAGPEVYEQIIVTELDVPLGHSVVLGTAGKGGLVLILKPEAVKGRD